MFKDCEKYFVIVEGEERAIIRNTYKDAVRKKKKLARHSGGKNIYIFCARLKE